MNVKGHWSRVADPTAAGGFMLSTPDTGWSSLSTPLAAPANYFEIRLTAAAATPYRVWLRMRGAANSKWNESVWVQFAGAVDAAGAALYPIGSTSGLLVNLEDCMACGIAGWGWQNTAYWFSQLTTIRFRTAGEQIIRVQTREDGVQIDQVVLSPVTYLSYAPGGKKSDATIVAKPIVPVPTSFQSPAPAIPGLIEAENFDNGGQTVAYFDGRRGNEGGAYRPSDDVDLAPSSEGGFTVGWVSAGEWLKYTVNVGAAGTYRFEARVASAGRGGTFHLEAASGDVSGPLSVPDTGGWQQWTTLSVPVRLDAGVQILKLVFDSIGPTGAVANITWMRFSTQAPYRGTSNAVPGVIRAEMFDEGGEGLAYHDTSAGNNGGAVRQESVDIEASVLGGYDVGWTAAGEWLAYTVTVAAEGTYNVQLNVASPHSSGRLRVMFGNVGTPSLPVPNTGGWQRWTTIAAQVTLPAGPQVMRVVVDGAGFNFGDIALTRVVAASPQPAPSPAPAPTPAPVSTTHAVNAGGDLQAALNVAQPGDTIVLQAGATFVGNFVLPAKTGTRPIVVTTSSVLPQRRITPADAPLMPKLKAPPNGAPALSTAPGAHHYTIVGIEFLPNPGGINDIVTLGDGSGAQSSLAVVPYDLVIDRCYIHGDPIAGQKRGIALNSASTTISNSHISDIKSVAQDSQAIAGWNGPGPYLILNNYLEAAGENVLFGGADPAIAGLVPSDITVRRNHLSKPLAWRAQNWQVKNLFELKNAQRVTIDGNLMENNWLAAQTGYAVLFTPRNQDGRAPWSVVRDVQFTNNIVRHVASVFSILGNDNNYPSQTTTNIVISNNLFEDVSGARYGGSGRFMLVNGGVNIVVDHNTVLQDGMSVVFADGAPVRSFTFANNIVPDYSWAIFGAAVGFGNPAIATFFPESTFRANVFAGSNPAVYPPGNFYPSGLDAVGFGDLMGGNYRLAPGSPYRGAGTDGKDLGCDVEVINVTVGTNY
jgi:hypothetical protein